MVGRIKNMKKILMDGGWREKINKNRWMVEWI